ncbi:hypothetical protein SAMN05444397_10146 [Flavobacterium aquidurense]|uniref:hypothetical protein n=1 Tax=Flavobacterium frigidimaris TaxID=262320 RepID=UPI00089859D1|nr:hypothetical protein [Flavobacterium frigidimaris]SDY20932.1 hypothetical protein SAMN05444397_10146 [Flavobacterium aquidurense]
MTKKILFSILIISFLSFSSEDKTVELSYPKNEAATIIMKTNLFDKFEKEWRGEDYYYLCEKGESKIICSVLFYKLNKDEQKMMVDSFDPEGKTTSPIIPFTYFMNSNLAKYEKNFAKWGEPTDDFMFKQTDIPEFEGQKVNQKNMYAYCMFGKDLFVNIHLSKINCTKQDSIVMRKVLNDLKKKK